MQLLLYLLTFMPALLNIGCTSREDRAPLLSKDTSFSYLVSFEKKYTFSAQQLKDKYG